MRLPRGRRPLIALGATALAAGVGLVAVAGPSGPKAPVRVEAAGDRAVPEVEDVLPGEREPSSTTTTLSPSSSTTATTVARPTTTTAPPTTTTTREACAPAAPIYAFGLVRLPDGNGWAGAANPALRRSGDGGQTWTSACLPASSVPGPGSVQAVHFADDGRHGWAVGVSGGLPVTFRTEDGGDHWTAGRVGIPTDLAGGLNDVAFAGTRAGWAVGHLSGPSPANGTGGILLHSPDGGRAWTSHPIPPGTGRLSRISVVDATHAWAVGTSMEGRPVILATNDGITWAFQTVPAGIRELRDIAFVDSRRGWAVGALPVPAGSGQDDPGAILATDDGGATWTVQTETVGSLWSVDAVDGRTVYAGGGRGLFSTRDGGATWTKQPFALPALDSIDFTDADHGWVTHSMFSTVCRTDDGGHSWIASDVRPNGKGTDCLP